MADGATIHRTKSDQLAGSLALGFRALETKKPAWEDTPKSVPPGRLTLSSARHVGSSYNLSSDFVEKQCLSVVDDLPTSDIMLGSRAFGRS
jgi:hypothetical protein